jgi:zinc D-Ala-D-Ala carboxypeptidase
MKKRKISHGAKRITGLLLMFFLIFIAYVLVANGPLSTSIKNYASIGQGWNLILVNQDNYIPDDYDIELTVLSNGESVDSRIYADLQDMFDNARSAGIYPIVGSGFRTQEKQQTLLDEKIEAYQADGHSKAKARGLAKKWVAMPGTSEHQLGLAVDINADKSKSTNDEVYDWLANNAYQYGFILRYPADKTDITGTIYEPWHYRYVGKDVAKEIYSKGICLEEYIDGLK